MHGRFLLSVRIAINTNIRPVKGKISLNKCSTESPAAFMRQDGRFLHGVFSRFLFPTVLSVLGGTVNVMVDSAIAGQRTRYLFGCGGRICLPARRQLPSDRAAWRRVNSARAARIGDAARAQQSIVCGTDDSA